MRFVLFGALALGAIFCAALTVTPVSAAGVGNFTKSCSGSKALQAMFVKAPDKAQGDMDTLCKCVADAVAPTVTDGQLLLLTANVAGTMTDDQRDAFDNDDATQKLATDAMNGCLESTAVAKDYGG